MNKKIAYNIGVDAGMIMVFDPSYLDQYKFADIMSAKNAGLGKMIKVPNGSYEVSWRIRNTWNGNINGFDNLKVVSGKVYVCDPCYVLQKAKQEEWEKWLHDNLQDKTDPNSPVIPNSPLAFMIQSMGGDGCYTVEMTFNKIKSEKKGKKVKEKKPYYKPVPEDILHAFGFRKAGYGLRKIYGSQVYWNAKLGTFYTPHIHSQRVFAANIMRHAEASAKYANQPPK